MLGSSKSECNRDTELKVNKFSYGWLGERLLWSCGVSEDAKQMKSCTASQNANITLMRQKKLCLDE